MFNYIHLCTKTFIIVYLHSFLFSYVPITYSIIYQSIGLNMVLFKNIVLAVRWLFTTYNVMSRNVMFKKRLVTITNCDITLLSVNNHYKSLKGFIEIF